MRLALLLLMLITSASQAATVTIGAALNRPPYIVEDAESGLELEIVRAAFAEVGMDVRFKFYSVKRQLMYYEKERLDGVMTVNGAFGLSGYPSEPYIYYRNVAITLKARQLKIDRVGALAGLSVAAFENASLLLGSEFKKVSGDTLYREFEPQYAQNRMLYLGRIDVAVADRYVFIANNQMVSHEVDTSQELEFHEVFPRTAYQLILRNSVVRDAFNEGLVKLKKSGRYQELVKDYLG